MHVKLTLALQNYAEFLKRQGKLPIPGTFPILHLKRDRESFATGILTEILII